MNHMLVEKPGVFSLLQDTGRNGYQRYGVPVNGPMDEWAHRVANTLVGNGEEAATLECTLKGPSISFSRNTLIALSGADMRVTAGGAQIPMHCAVVLRHGVRLEFGERRSGARSYLAVRGGFDAPLVLGSRSTYVRGGFGGFEGRALRRGDRVPVASPRGEVLELERMMIQSGMPFVAAAAPDTAPLSSATQALRFVPGPQWQSFTSQARHDFESACFRVSAQSDRMGYRLEGPELRLAQPLEMISEVVTFGTVQVPPGGSPIVLMADRQSAGGYPKLAYVASADLPSLAQALPGDALRFQAITQAEAEALCLEVEDRFARVSVLGAKALGLPIP
ncbi:biotin-dependent carboxyltransferase family protein [Cupriavidus basilensis]|uniref:5-oxoprolinase subunit C family protein n=1 Tax=Cupriavidus basilensis TaxID=68895 RepID=UPI0020A6769B|nr:biotin-dependent carboxyltransferase family protein [Cupriavidus basilensis]MCP3018116.1 biotin-dependent carboxyltransferase family protein [Cupriavidus basilensis]